MVLMSLRRAMGGDRCAWLEFCPEGMWLKCGERAKKRKEEKKRDILSN